MCTAQAKLDDDLLDDVVDGESVADRRKQQAADGEAKRAAEDQRAKQSAQDLSYMSKNTASKIDDRDRGSNF